MRGLHGERPGHFQRTKEPLSMAATQSVPNDYLCFLFFRYSDLPALVHSLHQYLSVT